MNADSTAIAPVVNHSGLTLAQAKAGSLLLRRTRTCVSRDIILHSIGRGKEKQRGYRYSPSSASLSPEMTSGSMEDVM